MSAKVKQLHDKDNAKIYPVTKAAAVYMSNGKDTVERILYDEIDQDTEIEFKTNGNIEKTLASGSKIVTEFGADGTITETTTNADGVVVQIKTYTFNADGSIDISVEYDEEEGEE